MAARAERDSLRRGCRLSAAAFSLALAVAAVLAAATASSLALVASSFSALRSLRGIGLLGIVALLALHDAGGIEEAGDAIGRLRALLHPVLDLLEVELEALFLVLRQQRIEVAETLDEAAIARRARCRRRTMW